MQRCGASDLKNVQSSPLLLFLELAGSPRVNPAWAEDAFGEPQMSTLRFFVFYPFPWIRIDQDYLQLLNSSKQIRTMAGQRVSGSTHLFYGFYFWARRHSG
jgi:hypothetical protein